MIKRWWLSPPGWAFHAVCAIPGLGLLWSASFPGSDFLLSIFSLGLAVGFAAIWLARLITYVARERRVSWLFAIAPVAGALLLAIDVFTLPLTARFAFDEAAFDRAATSVEAGHGVPGHIGTYQVQSVNEDGDQIVFTVD